MAFGLFELCRWWWWWRWRASDKTMTGKTQERGGSRVWHGACKLQQLFKQLARDKRVACVARNVNRIAQCASQSRAPSAECTLERDASLECSRELSRPPAFDWRHAGAIRIWGPPQTRSRARARFNEAPAAREIYLGQRRGLRNDSARHLGRALPGDPGAGGCCAQQRAAAMK